MQIIVGADLSKKTIDLFCFQTSQYLQVQNSAEGYLLMEEWLIGQSIDLRELLLVMEHTGLYSHVFEQYLYRRQISFSKQNALAIKRSMGIVRGKTDKIDARRIATFGFEKRHLLQVEVPQEKELQSLQQLHSTRERLVKLRAALLNAVKEYRHMGLSEKDGVVLSQTRLIKQFDKEIALLQAKVSKIIEQEDALHQSFKLLKSIKGVGEVLATATIIKTRNFKKFTDPRKFACFCGTAPFEHSSGTSIKGRTRVSHLADKKMKTLLDLAAKSAIQHDAELKQYYQRKTAEGKSKMSTINVVRNKIIYRMFAVIKRKSIFIDHYLNVA